MSWPKRQAGSPTRRRGLARFGSVAAGLAIVATLPAILLFRAPMAFYAAYDWNPWLAIAMGSALCAALLGLTLGWGTRRLLGARPGPRTFAVLLAVVLAGATYTVIHLPVANAKTPEIEASYSALQPILRLSVGALLLFDPDLVLTDGPRRPARYREMGLVPPPRSAHYTQPDGYAHAVDLRTRGRSWLRNGLVRLYFEALGFETLRHAGTADHLHVAMPSLATAPHSM